MPLGDSITEGAFPWGNASGGYRLPLYQDLTADGLAFQFVGSQIDTRSAALQAAGKAAYEGHAGFGADDIADHLLGANPSRAGGNGGHWLDGTGSRRPVYPDMVLLMAGTNDVMEGFPAPAAAASIDRLLGILFAARPTAHVLVGSLLPIDDPRHLATVRTLNAVIRKKIVPECRQRGGLVTFVDHYANFVNANGTVNSSLLYDRTHPVAAGYALIASTWSTAIGAVLAREI
jgi:lysophospholipase L1-like esterase